MRLGDNFWVSLCWMGVFVPWFLFSLGLLVFVICVSGDWQDLWSIKESPSELGGRNSDSYSGLWSIRASLFFWLTHLAPKYGVSPKGGDRVHGGRGRLRVGRSVNGLILWDLNQGQVSFLPHLLTGATCTWAADISLMWGFRYGGWGFQ